MNSTVE